MYKGKPAQPADDTAPGPISTPIARGTVIAREQEFKNRRAEYDSEISNLERMRTSRGSLQARYDGYVRVYNRLERLAKTLVNEFNVTGLEIPVFDPPALTGSVKMRRVEPTASADASYRETAGRGPSGKGLPTAAPVPGSAADGNWMSNT